MKLSDLQRQVNDLVEQGKGDLPVFIMDGYSGLPYEWSGSVRLKVYDDVEADADLAASKLTDGDEYVELGFG